MFGGVCSFTCTYIEPVCARMCVIMHVCSVSVQEAAGAASPGVFCGMSLLSLSHSHEMGKHEIKVEKTHKRVEGG